MTASGSSGAGGPSAALRDALLDEASRLGLTRAGVVRAEPTEHLEPYREWLARSYHGEMAYLARPDAVERRADPSHTLADVRSILVVADDYHRAEEPNASDDSSRGVIARYARGADYHRVLKRKLLALARWIDETVEGGVAARAYVDTGPILERDLGRRAGLGWFGRNTMLIHPRAGSYFFLGVLLLDVDLPPTDPFEADHCGTCRACLDACPTGALLGRDETGAPIMDARRCISYLTIEHRGPIAEELRPAIGNRIYGCDICQEVCPFNVRFARESEEPRYRARGRGERPHGVEAEAGRRASDHPGTTDPALVDLLHVALDPEAWDDFSRGSAIRRAGRAGFARNVCVALGNAGDLSAAEALLEALKDADPVVRGHAAWALGRVDPEGSRTALKGAEASETDPFVLGELRRAIGA